MFTKYLNTRFKISIMKLYRLIIITPTANISRGVWANYIRLNESYVEFIDSDRETLAVYPTKCTIITNIETKEEYDRKKESI